LKYSFEMNREPEVVEMGCDIHLHAERREGDKWVGVELPRKPMWEGASYTEAPLHSRSYGTFAFLAGVRNYSEVTPIAEPRGFPADASPEVKADHETWDLDAHTASWLSLEELQAYDYDQKMEDRRYTQQTGPNSFNGGATCEPGEGKKMTVREFLCKGFFDDLETIKRAGADRIVFWFDN